MTTKSPELPIFVCATADTNLAVGKRFTATNTTDTLQNTFAESMGLREKNPIYIVTCSLTKICVAQPTQSGIVYANTVIAHKHQRLHMLTADCIALALYCSQCHIHALSHVGWNTLCTKHISRLVEKINTLHKCGKEYINVTSSPAICANCYINRGWRGVIKNYLLSLTNKHYQRQRSVNLRGIVIQHLIRAGIIAKHITLNATCTAEMPQLSSYRRDGTNRTNANLAISGFTSRNKA